MRRSLILVLFVGAALLPLCGCGSGPSASPEQTQNLQSNRQREQAEDAKQAP